MHEKAYQEYIFLSIFKCFNFIISNSNFCIFGINK